MNEHSICHNRSATVVTTCIMLRTNLMHLKACKHLCTLVLSLILVDTFKVSNGTCPYTKHRTRKSNSTVCAWLLDKAHSILLPSITVEYSRKSSHLNFSYQKMNHLFKTPKIQK